MIFGSLLGTIVGSLFGFKAQEIVQNWNFHIQNILNKPLTVPKLRRVLMIFGLLYSKKLFHNFIQIFHFIIR
jgi:hypothetical protein